MLRQIFSAYISLKESILERMKTSNKNKVEYGLLIPSSLNLFTNKTTNVWKCTVYLTSTKKIPFGLLKSRQIQDLCIEKYIGIRYWTSI